jgi:hypothetical protein
MSEETKFTQGPWLAEGELEPMGSCLSRLVVGVDSAVACVLFDDEDDPTAEANATLITAATQLYWALFKLARAADACAPQCEDIPGDVQARMNEAFAVLATARGE